MSSNRVEWCRDGERKKSQSSPIGKKSTSEMKTDAEGSGQDNPNESLSDWEEEFLGRFCPECYFWSLDSFYFAWVDS